MKKVLITLIVAIIVISNIELIIDFITYPVTLFTIAVYSSLLYYDKKKAYDNLLNDYNDLINKRRIANNG